MPASLKKIVLFLLFLIAAMFLLDRMVRHLVLQCPVGNTAKVNLVMTHRLDAEVTVWGASTAEVHFNTEMMSDRLAMSSINVGLDGTPFNQYSGLLKEYLSYSRNSRLLVIALDINGLGSRTALYQGYSWLHFIQNDNIYESIKTIDPDLAVKSRYVPLYYLTTYDRRFLVRCFKWVYISMDVEPPALSHNGYHPNPILEWQAVQHRLYDKQFDVPIDARVVSGLKKILGEASKKNIRVAIVVTPCYAEAQKRFRNKEEFDTVLGSLESEKVKVFSYLSNPLCSDRNNFSNNTHLNINGANKFTEEFINDISKWLYK